MLDIIEKFNAISDTNSYIYAYYLLGIIAFLLSYISQHLSEKPCKNIYAEVIRIIHHFAIYFIYFGVLAPAKYLWIAFTLMTGTVLSWIYYNNKCFLTVWENILCGKNVNYVFRYITYYLSKSYDEYLSRIRIHLFCFLTLIVLLRMYFYYNTKKIEIQGHRGARGKYPENTISAFKYALDNNIDVLELDLQLTTDNKLIIYHDKDINRYICSNGNEYSSPIKSLTLEEIKEYDCGSKKNNEFPNQILSIGGEKIPTFEELIYFVNNNYYFKNIKYNIEIKTTKELDTDEEVKQFVDTLMYIIHKNNIKNNVIIQSFDPRALEYVRQLDHKITTSYVIDNKEDLLDIIKKLKSVKANIISPDYLLVNEQFVKEIHNNGLKVLPWTINDTNIFQKMINYGVDGIITDYPVEMKNYLYENNL